MQLVGRVHRIASGHRSSPTAAREPSRLPCRPVRAAAEPKGSTLSADQWKERGRQRARQEVIASGPRLGLKADVLGERLDALAALLPGLTLNLELMKASDWAKVVADPELASKVILIKTSFPTVNVEVLLDRHPRTLLWSLKLLQSNIEQVAPVLGALPRPEKVLETLPELLDPRQCFSVVASIRKWYTKRDPLEVLQMDPEVIRRAERVDVPLEPVFLDPATGIWTAAGYSREKQEEWQVYIEQKVYKRKPQPIDKMTVLKVGGSPVAAGAAEGEGPTVADAAAVAAALGLMPLPLPAGEGLEVAVSEAPAEEAGPRQGAAAAGLAGQGQVAGP